MKLKKFLTLSLATICTFTFIACGKDSTDKTPPSTSTTENKKIVKVGTSDPLIKEMLDAIMSDYKSAGYNMEVTLFDGDIISPNNAVAEGSLDINFYQHQAFLKQFNKDKGTNLVPVGDPIYFSKMGIYSSKLKNITDIKDKMKLAIPSDATNKSRALIFLQDEGLIKLKQGLETYSKLDIIENKYNLNIIEMDTTKIPSALPDVDFAVVRSLQIMKAKLDPQSALAFDKHGKNYGILLAAKKGNENAEWAKTLSKCLKSSKIKDILEKKYGTTSELITND